MLKTNGKWERGHRGQRNAQRRQPRLRMEDAHAIPKRVPDPLQMPDPLPAKEARGGWRILIGIGVLILGVGAILVGTVPPLPRPPAN